MTTELRLDEVLVESVIAKLQGVGGVNAGWPARAAAINTEKSDDVTISSPDPANYFEGRVNDLVAVPACFVLAGPTGYKEQGNHSMLTTTSLFVSVIDEDSSGPRLARRLMRQARAIIETLYDDAPMEQTFQKGSTTVVAAYRVFPVKSVPGSVFQPSGQGWRGTYLIVFRAEQEEN